MYIYIYINIYIYLYIYIYTYINIDNIYIYIHKYIRIYIGIFGGKYYWYFRRRFAPAHLFYFLLHVFVGTMLLPTLCVLG